MHSTHSTLSKAQSHSTFSGRTVLCADDSETVLRALEIRCQGLGFQVEKAKDGLQTLLRVAKGKLDLLILDLNLPDTSGFRVIERLTDPKFPPLPVIILTSQSDTESIQRCEDLGVLYVHKAENVWDELEKAIQRVFSEKREGEPTRVVPDDNLAERAHRILLVDDDPITLRWLTSVLQKQNFETIQATGGMKAFWLALRWLPDLIITDYNMDEGSGSYLLGRIKSTPATAHIPVVVFTASTLTEGQIYPIRRDLVGRGEATEFLAKSLTPEVLLETVRKHIDRRLASGRHAANATNAS